MPARHGRLEPFVPFNCAAIPESLIESQFFGHEAGAYTDARSRQRGAFELADGGTLFLDEVGDLSLAAQPEAVASAGERRVSFRVGGEAPCRVDVRILAATNHNLRAMQRENRFRSDLYYRLRVLTIEVPPLRDRREDIPTLAEHFARAAAAKCGRGPRRDQRGRVRDGCGPTTGRATCAS